MTRDEMIGNLANHVAALATRFKQLYEELLATRRSLDGLNNTMDDRERELRFTLETVGKQLAAEMAKVAVQLARLDKGVDVMREVTGAHPLPPPDPVAIRIWDRFERAPKRVQRMIVILGILLAVGGWASALLHFWVGH